MSRISFPYNVNIFNFIIYIISCRMDWLKYQCLVKGIKVVVNSGLLKITVFLNLKDQK